MSEAIAQVPLIKGGFRGIVDMKRWCYTTAILKATKVSQKETFVII